MGDDGTPRYVLSTTTGTDEMYSIVNTAYHVSYTVNKEHILTLANVVTNTVEDVSLSWLLENQDLIGIQYQGFRSSVDMLYNLSRKERMDFINAHFGTRRRVRILDPNLHTKLVFYARSLGLSVTYTDHDVCIKSGKPDVYPFVIQPVGVGNYVGFELDGNGRFMLGDFSVTHNTAIAINIATKIRAKTLVITHRLILMDQWKSSIERFCPEATVCCLTSASGKKSIDESAQFYIINAINIPKFAANALDFCRFCIVDECHLIASKVLSQSLLHVHPSYLLGLSASPYRLDGLTPMLHAFFGSEPVLRMVENLCRVYKIVTKFEPDLTYMRNGKLDWGRVINSLSFNPVRNAMIVDIVKKFPERTFLLLTKRIEQANQLAKMFDALNIEYGRIYGAHSCTDPKHVLIGTLGKCGVGFDAPSLNTLILCCDIVNYYEQVLGRIMRNRATQSWVFDIVDDHAILHNHYRQRAKIYKTYQAEYMTYPV